MLPAIRSRFARLLRLAAPPTLVFELVAVLVAVRNSLSPMTPTFAAHVQCIGGLVCSRRKVDPREHRRVIRHECRRVGRELGRALLILDNEDPTVLLQSMSRFFKFLPGEQRQAFESFVKRIRPKRPRLRLDPKTI